MVEAEDQAGNPAADPTCYTFATPEVPDFFTEQSPGDLENITLFFTPNGSVDYYGGCTIQPITALPVDPAGGTSISLSDDDSEAVSPSSPVYLYGVAYNSFYVGSNGYLTFGTSDTEYDESLEHHFSIPRVAGMFRDLNPSSGGTVSWKESGSGVAVTYDGVYTYNTTNPNTFQIHLYYDGCIEISYMSMSANDGIVGLSEGEGLDPDYYPSDLNMMPSCGDRPPVATSFDVITDVNTPVGIRLLATDDGLPDPPAALTYIVVSLPAHGVLYDAGAGQITSVPYALVGGGDEVTYTPGRLLRRPGQLHLRGQ